MTTINVKISRETALQRISEALEKLDDDSSLFDLYRDFYDNRAPLALTIDGVRKRFRFEKTTHVAYRGTVVVLPETEGE